MDIEIMYVSTSTSWTQSRGAVDFVSYNDHVMPL